MDVDNNEIEMIFESLQIKIYNIIKIKTLVNFLFKVETDKNNYYVKIYEDLTQSRIGSKLAYLYPFLNENKIPVPKVVKYDDTLGLIKYPYIIITEIQGEMLCDVIGDMDDKEKLNIYNEFGKITAHIHSITYNTFGEVFNDNLVDKYIEANNKGPFGNWKNMHIEIIKHRLSLFKNSSFEDLIEPIFLWFDKNSNLIDYEITPRLLHIDLNMKNILIKNNKISGVIDFDGAVIGHNEEELMRIEGAHFSNNNVLKESFFKGYTDIINLDENFEKRRIYYYFSRLLVHVGCIIEFGNNYSDVENDSRIAREEILKIFNNKEINFDKNNSSLLYFL
ncbi:MAG: aminoglycoside phosphotransferase family protein [Candidatus Woesearchaeota archaeon]